MKPVASGAERSPRGLLSEDVERILAAGNVAAPRKQVNPYCFEPPIAPHIAAQRAGIAIELGPIVAAYRALARRADVVIVEGVGGFLVPLGRSTDTARLAARLALPVVLVVGLRLGCLNHALLTVEAIAARGLVLAGWVANQIDPGMAAAEQNVGALEERIAAPLIGRIAHAAAPDPRALASALDLSLLIRGTRDATARV